MERADQSVITQGILCHILKYLRRLKVLALPKQCNDSVIAVVGQNCPNLESIVLNDTGVTNTGQSIFLFLFYFQYIPLYHFDIQELLGYFVVDDFIRSSC